MSIVEDILLRIKGEDDTGGLFSGVEGKASALKAAVGAAMTAIGYQTLNFAESCVNSAIEAERGWNAYMNAVERASSSTITSTAELKKEVKDLAYELGRTTGEVRQAETDYLNMGMSIDDANTAIKATSGVAAAMGTDFSGAQGIIEGALKGQARALKNVGINLNDYKDKSTGAIDKTRLLNDIMNKFISDQEDFAGSAEAKMNRLNGRIMALKTSLGEALLPIVEKLVPVVEGFVNFLTEHPILTGILAGVMGIVGGLGLLAGPILMISQLILLLKEWELATKLMTAAQWLLNIALDSNPIGAVVLAIIGLIAILVIAYYKVDWFRGMVNGFIDDLKGLYSWLCNVIDAIQKMCDAADETINHPVETASKVTNNGTNPYMNPLNMFHGAGGVLAGLSYNPVQSAGNPSYNKTTNNNGSTVVLGSLNVDARNLTKHEAKQVIIGALEDLGGVS